VKRLRRKQSNRESARRSRLRKQAECEQLAQRVKELQQGEPWGRGWQRAGVVAWASFQLPKCSASPRSMFAARRQRRMQRGLGGTGGGHELGSHAHLPTPAPSALQRTRG
jgi:hypothetical protein